MPGRYNLYSTILAVLLSAPAAAADQWVKLTTPDFELYTTAGEQKGREALLYFEQTRGLFLESSALQRVSEFPVRIVLFHEENQSAAAHYSRARIGDYVVMHDPGNAPAAIHEYTQLLLQQAGMHPPFWLQEGLADLFSTLKPIGKQAEVGETIPGGAQTLQTGPWIPLEALTTAGRQSPLYRDRASFDAESWALTHLLFFSPDYRRNFSRFLAATSSGEATDHACRTAFGKPLSEVEAALREYVKNARFYRATFDIKSVEEPEVFEVSTFESGLLLADLLAASNRIEEAAKAYQQLALSDPDQPELDASVGYLAWQSGDSGAARDLFARAISAGSKNARLCFDYAMLSRQGRDAVKNAIPAFQKALELKPDYAEAHFQFGMMLVNTHNYPAAVAQLRLVQVVDPQQAQWYFPALALAYLKTGDLEKSRENAAAARRSAKTAQQIQLADELLRSAGSRPATARAATLAVDQRPRMQKKEREQFQVTEEGPPLNPFVAKDDKMSRVEGVAQRLDCSGKAARFHVLVGKTSMIFAIPDPDRVQIKHSGEMKHDFGCGVQKPYKVAVDYAILPDTKAGTVGIVRGLEF